MSANSQNTAAQGISSFSLGRSNADLGFGGLVLSAGSESVSVLLRALAQTRQLDVLSRPQIRTLDNQLAEIQVGQEVPVVDGATITNNVTNPTIRRDEAGILLSVTPRISPDGQIVMEVIAEKSQFTGAGVPVLIDAVTGNVIESPIKDISVVRTTVSVSNNQTIVLGGMITKTDETITRKVPWLGDIPYLGVPFRFDSVTSKRTELLIFLTPRIIRNDEESEMIKQIEAKRLHFMEDAAEEMHGPLYAVPAENEMILDEGNGEIESETAPPADDLDTPTSIIPGKNPELLQVPADIFDEQTLFSDEAELFDHPFKLQQTLIFYD